MARAVWPRGGVLAFLVRAVVFVQDFEFGYLYSQMFMAAFRKKCKFNFSSSNIVEIML